MVLEKEHWQKLPPDTVQEISFAGLVGDGAPLIALSGVNRTNNELHDSAKSVNSADATTKKSGFTSWLKRGNPFSQKLMHPKDAHGSPHRGMGTSEYDAHSEYGDKISAENNVVMNGNTVLEDENEDLLADFIDEDSQLPSRISKPNASKSHSLHRKNDEITAQTGSSLCLLR